MKKLLVLLIIMCFLTACGDSKVIDGKVYDTYGMFNEDEASPDIEYRIIKGNVVWSILTVESVLLPIYFIGFSLYEPIGKKGEL